jgi:hypothetical protein
MLEVVCLLLKSGADIDAEGGEHSAAHQIALKGVRAKIALLLSWRREQDVGFGPF